MPAGSPIRNCYGSCQLLVVSRLSGGSAVVAAYRAMSDEMSQTFAASKLDNKRKRGEESTESPPSKIKRLKEEMEQKQLQSQAAQKINHDCLLESHAAQIKYFEAVLAQHARRQDGAVVVAVVDSSSEEEEEDDEEEEEETHNQQIPYAVPAAAVVVAVVDSNSDEEDEEEEEEEEKTEIETREVIVVSSSIDSSSEEEDEDDEEEEEETHDQHIPAAVPAAAVALAPNATPLHSYLRFRVFSTYTELFINRFGQLKKAEMLYWMRQVGFSQDAMKGTRKELHERVRNHDGIMVYRFWIDSSEALQRLLPIAYGGVHKDLHVLKTLVSAPPPPPSGYFGSDHHDSFFDDIKNQQHHAPYYVCTVPKRGLSKIGTEGHAQTTRPLSDLYEMPDSIAFYRNEAGLSENESIFLEGGRRQLLGCGAYGFGGRSNYSCDIDTILPDRLENRLRHDIKNWLLNDEYDEESITRWLEGTVAPRIILGDGAKPGFTGYTPIWGRPSIPTRAPITLSELALQANDELCFNLTPPTVSQQYGIDFAGSMQLVCRVAEIENEKDTLLPLVKLRNGVMCRTSTPLFVGE